MSDRLTAEDAARNYRIELDAALAEVTRLREALTKVADESWGWSWATVKQHLERTRDIARAALAEGSDVVRHWQPITRRDLQHDADMESLRYETQEHERRALAAWRSESPATLDDVLPTGGAEPNE